MRISTVAMQRLAINSILNQQSELSRTQLQLSTGNRIINPIRRSARHAADHGARCDPRADRSVPGERRAGQGPALARGKRAGQRNGYHPAGQGAGGAGQQRHLHRPEPRPDRHGNPAAGGFSAGNGEQPERPGRVSVQRLQKQNGSVHPRLERVVYNGDQGQRQLRVSESQQVADGDPGSRVFLEVPTGNGTFAVAASEHQHGRRRDSARRGGRPGSIRWR